uniref:Serpin domain-containing protein n=1 Tax=Timema cristinae TaxID=61476 RepID=A0A7R9GYJ1_TIMCR|nr:unnamed protein product [Timema cristinae]
MATALKLAQLGESRRRGEESSPSQFGAITNTRRGEESSPSPHGTASTRARAVTEKEGIEETLEGRIWQIKSFSSTPIGLEFLRSLCHRQLAEQKDIKTVEDSNFVVSPLVIRLAVSLFLLIARGQTAKEIADVLHLKSDIEELKNNALQIKNNMLNLAPFQIHYFTDKSGNTGNRIRNLWICSQET